MTDIERGLTDAEVEKNRSRFGENRIEKPARKGFFKRYLENFSDPIIRILLGALFINIVFMIPNINWFECGGIAISVLVSTLVSTYSEFSNENAFEKLKEQSEGASATVKRNGKIEEIPAEKLVVGDIVLLSSGTRIQADALVVKGEISVDESMLTGESAEVKRGCDDGEILKGSLVCSGSCMCEVKRVGDDTYYGKTAKELAADTRPSPLKERLTVLAKAISKIGYISAVLIAFAYLFNVFLIDSSMNFSQALLKMKDTKFLISKLLSALTLAISVVVVAVPEGLPMMITVVLSSNMKRMIKDNVIVRKPVGIETSGNINLLFTDKTGTITEGVLKAKAFFTPVGEEYLSANGIKEGTYKKYLTLCSHFCGDIEINGQKRYASNPTDRAISDFFKRQNEKCRVLHKIPFDSSKKYCSAAVELGEKRIALFKGAPEKLIYASEKIMDAYGNLIPIVEKERILRTLSSLTSRSYRVVALAVREGEDTEPSSLTLLGFMALKDKVRYEAPKAIREVTEAGVGIIMITGDNRETAEAIARECGIISSYSKRNLVITGEELSYLSDGEVGDILDSLAVVARVLPTDKSRLVRIAQERGFVVGMTGDGINDASSLKLADVGFSMGSGTDVAKEASDIVIADNNFKSVCKAILYGRTIFEAIRSFIVFQLTMNLGAMGISLIGPFIGVDSPVTVSQMLWVNIIMDTLGALAFASEPPLYEYMKCKPKSRGESILNGRMLKKILANGFFIIVLCIWFLKSDGLCMIFNKCDEMYILSGFFAMFCFMSIFVCFISRTDRVNLLASVSKNKAFVPIMLLIAFVQIGFIYLGGEAFRSVPLMIDDLISVILISGSVCVFDLLRKLISKKSASKERSKAYKTPDTHNI